MNTLECTDLSHHEHDPDAVSACCVTLTANRSSSMLLFQIVTFYQLIHSSVSCCAACIYERDCTKKMITTIVIVGLTKIY